MYAFSLETTLLAHSLLSFCRNTLTGYTDDRRCSPALISKTVTVPDGTIQKRQTCDHAPEGAVPLTEFGPWQTSYPHSQT